MSNIKLSFLLTTIAGLSTMLGCLLIFIKTKNHKKIIASSLAFASGVMICVSITDLIPEAINMLRANFNFISNILLCIIAIILGMIISMLIDYYLPDNNLDDKENKSLYKVGIMSMLAIILHNIPEGIATFVTTSTNIKLGISLAIAIALHNIPEGISISIPIYYATKSKKKVLLYTFISAISETFGAIIAYLFLKQFINYTTLGILFAFIAGIMLEISLCQILPTSINYKYKKSTFIFFTVGIVFMLVKFLF